MNIFGRNSEAVGIASEDRQARIARAERLGLQVLKHAPPGNSNPNATGHPLALPETQEILEQRRLDKLAQPTETSEILD